MESYLSLASTMTYLLYYWHNKKVHDEITVQATSSISTLNDFDLCIQYLLFKLLEHFNCVTQLINIEYFALTFGIPTNDKILIVLHSNKISNVRALSLDLNIELHSSYGCSYRMLLFCH